MIEQNDELQHHGVRGQKWGIRRFQNRDGSLTSAGRKRAKLTDKYAIYKKRKEEKKKKIENNKPKTVKDLSDDELRTKVNRLRMEKESLQLERDIASFTPQKVSLGKKFITSLGKNVIAPAATNAGKDILEKWMKNVGNDLVNPKTLSKKEQLQKEVDMLNLERDKLDYSNQIDRLKEKSTQATTVKTKSKTKTKKSKAAKESDIIRGQISIDEWMKKKK